ncbi:MAG: 3-phosphoshikimate 1-carboxyvinyltransferase [Bacteroidota bacterium]
MSFGKPLSVQLPSSKSISNRWLILQRLSEGDIRLDGLSDSTDTRTLQRLLQDDGVDHDAGDGGTTFRFMLAILSLLPGTHRLAGNSRMAQRPMKELIDALSGLGAVIHTDPGSGLFPLTIEGGHMVGGRVEIGAETSSQFISALALIGPFLKNGLEISIEGKVVSRSYIDMTLKILHQAGSQVNATTDLLKISPSSIKSQRVLIERDWSSAAFFYEACALKPGLTVHFPGLFFTGFQGDEAVADFFSDLGVTTSLEENGIKIHSFELEKKARLRFDLIDCPDLMPALTMTCFGRKQRVLFSGVRHLRLKESDRIQVLADAIQSQGGDIEVGDDTFELIGFPVENRSFNIDSCNDHRIAMSMAMFSASGCPVSLAGSDSVSKSFPGFWDAIEPLKLPVSRCS